MEFLRIVGSRLTDGNPLLKVNPIARGRGRVRATVYVAAGHSAEAGFIARER
jgi:hypothetical protein